MRGRGEAKARVGLTPLQRTALRLTAAPEEDERPVPGVRIIVSGDVVAEQGCGSCRDGTTEVIDTNRQALSVETVIPRS